MDTRKTQCKRDGKNSNFFNAILSIKTENS